MFLLALAALVAGAPGRAAPAAGGQAISLSLSPLLVELTLAQGARSSFDVSVWNQGRGGVARFRVYVCDILQALDGEYKMARPGSSPRSAVPWIKLSADRLTVEPGHAGSVEARVEIPRSARGGGYAAVVFELEPEARPSTGEQILGSNVFVYRMTSVVEITISERASRKQLVITSVGVTSALQDSHLRSRFGERALRFAATVRNEGPVHVLAKGTLTLRAADGRRLRQVPLGAGRGVILPEALVELGSVLSGGLPPGDYVVDISVSYGGVRPAAARAPFTVPSGAAPPEAGAVMLATPAATVEPGQAQLSLVPGAMRSFTLLVTNREEAPVHVQGRAIPLAFTPEGEISEELAHEDAWSCARWLTLSPQAFELKPQGRQTVRVAVTVPKDEKPGGRYANIIFDVSPSVGAGRPGEFALSRVGASVLASVGRNLTRAGSVTAIEVTPAAGGMGTTFAATFLNSGDLHVGLSWKFLLRRHVVPEVAQGIEYVGPGEYVEVEALQVPETGGVVLPGQRRTVSVDLMKVLEPGRYRVEAEVAYGGGQSAVGSTEFDVP